MPPNGAPRDQNRARRRVRENRSLRVDAGFSSEAGRRDDSQDYVGLTCEGTNNALGHVIAIADGVSFGGDGRVAAELAVRSFILRSTDIMFTGKYPCGEIEPFTRPRFGDVLELSMELDSGLDRAVPITLRRQSLYERNPLRFRQCLAALLGILLVVSLGVHVLR